MRILALTLAATAVVGIVSGKCYIQDIIEIWCDGGTNATFVILQLWSMKNSIFCASWKSAANRDEKNNWVIVTYSHKI